MGEAVTPAIGRRTELLKVRPCRVALRQYLSRASSVRLESIKSPNGVVSYAIILRGEPFQRRWEYGVVSSS